MRAVDARIAAGDDETIDAIGPGEILGEFAAIDGLPRSASAYALTDVDLVAIDPATALRVLATAPGVDLDALRSDVKAFRRRTERRAAAAGGQPVAALAAHLAGQLEEPGTMITLQPGLVADGIGVSHELTARALEHLHHAGILTLERGTVVVHDPGALREMATG